MNTPACCFRLAAWHAVSTRLHSAEDWAAWAQDRLCADQLPDTKPEVAFLPAMQRRRLGLSARLLFQAAHTVLGEHGSCPLVLASHDGEINRSFDLWQQLLREGSVSPTSFGLSVHNATAGQWSMLRQDMSECTALAVQQDGLETAVLEAAALLAEGAPRVLAVLTDEPLSADYPAQPALRAPFPYALALLLEPGDDWSLTPAPKEAEETADTTAGYWGALAWLRRHYRGEREWRQQYAGGRAWHWRRKA